MASFRIRQYQDQDFEAVRALFTRGVLEYAPACFWYVLRAGRVRLALLAAFVVARAATGSWMLGLGAFALALVLVWVLVRLLCNSYVRDALGTDLCDVPGTYQRSPDCRFWVVEEAGTVAAMVAAVPAGRGEMELKRMSVSREHRGRGLARMLCREVLAFARARGYGTVVLSTSVVQVVAQRLYEGQGFRKVGALYPSLLGILLNFQMLYYRCDLGDANK
ncbi:N-acetyltransferase 8-like [Zonotrichia leucophrys gambelii]|uniref:N-acetyltransferase 8-like n=1 Tax=Zonotrichia leucophrys gambelii TaxID=257770 RepID=UPI003140381B